MRSLISRLQWHPLSLARALLVDGGMLVPAGGMGFQGGGTGQQPTNDLQNKTAIITGAAAGIGAASAWLFAKEGAKVVAVDIDRELVDQISAQIGRAGGECLAVVADVSQRDQSGKCPPFHDAEFGRVGHSVNNAGIVPTANLRRSAKSNGTARDGDQCEEYVSLLPCCHSAHEGGGRGSDPQYPLPQRLYAR